MEVLTTILDYALLAFGFGFVIFFHELGHFLAAKYCDVKVEQFAVGFGPAVFAWRKGLGVAWGSTAQKMNAILSKEHEAAQPRVRADVVATTANGETVVVKERGPTVAAGGEIFENKESDESILRRLKISETEYRLNWVPLGGYVKMLGQDDLRPEAIASDPRAYNNKSIRARMVIVSAGVVMNIILAAIGFMVVFLRGWPTPAATVGSLVSQSPALRAVLANGTPAPLRPGDIIVSFDGKPMRNDFTKLILESALSTEGKPVVLVVRRHENNYVKDINLLPEETIYVTPQRPEDDAKNLPAMGISQPFSLEGADPKNFTESAEDLELESADMVSADEKAIEPGDVVTQINGHNVQPQEIWKLFDALQRSDGNPVKLTVLTKDGKTVERTISPVFDGEFSKGNRIDILGMMPRAAVEGIISPKSPARGKLKPGDVIVDVIDPEHGDHHPAPSVEELVDLVNNAGESGKTLNMMVLDPGQTQPRPEALTPSIKLPKGRIGLGIATGFDGQHAVVADVRADSPLHDKLKKEDVITAIDNHPVTNWFEIRRYLADATPDKDVTITYSREGKNGPQTATVKLTAGEIESINNIVVTSDSGIGFRVMTGDRKTSSPFVAIGWGAVETRDLILQFYLTLQRMITGGIPVGNMMGPVGIFSAGAQFAAKGTTWLLWFLAMISANLAVVNFLPIPIVDGGLFTFLILEKIQGRPLSPGTQKIVQVVGLALILGVFLLVTYQDIARLMGA